MAFETEWKHFSFPGAGRRRGGMVFAVACRLRTGLSHLPISPSPSSKPVVVRPLICCNLPLQSPCQDRSYFRSSSRLSSVANGISKTLKERRGQERQKTPDKRGDWMWNDGRGADRWHERWKREKRECEKKGDDKIEERGSIVPSVCDLIVCWILRLASESGESCDGELYM